jgi:hypothetical protein
MWQCSQFYFSTHGDFMFIYTATGLSSIAEMEMFGQAILDALQKARAGLDDASARVPLETWFGIDSTSGSFEKYKFARNLAAMRSKLLCCPISLTLQPRDPAPDENASAYPIGLKGTGARNSLQLYDKLVARNLEGFNASAKSAVALGANFVNLPDYGEQPLYQFGLGSRFSAQDKFETLVHELSHLILQTDDEKLANGKTAYGAQRALKLVQEDPARAQNNAENWGFFVEEFRA